MSGAKILFIFKKAVFNEKNSENHCRNYEPGGAKRGLTLFFTFPRKRGLEVGLGLFGGGVGAKRSRSRGGRVGIDAFGVA